MAWMDNEIIEEELPRTLLAGAQDGINILGHRGICLALELAVTADSLALICDSFVIG